MTLPRHPLRVALVQSSAGPVTGDNLAALARLLDRSPAGEHLLLLPEVFACRGRSEALRKAAEPLDGPSAAFLASLAQSRRCWVGGGIIESGDGRVFNTLLLFRPDGALAASYRKRNLFAARLEGGQVVDEREAFSAGSEAVCVDIEGWCCGLSICFDLRFPVLYQELLRQGAHLLLAPSNFTRRTGEDHWHLLTRARAVETQCFLAAANQCGPCEATGIPSFGHSIVIGPWGQVLAESADEPGVLRATLDPALLAEARNRIVMDMPTPAPGPWGPVPSS